MDLGERETTGSCMEVRSTMSELTSERVKELLEYNPETGEFTRIVKTTNSSHIGEVAGTLLPTGYRQISVDGRLYKASRLAFLVTHGRWPVPFVDHINGDRGDDRAANLREVTRRGNGQNRAEHRNGKLCGAHLDRRPGRRNPWYARIVIEGKRKCIGCFATEQEAHEAYLKACEAIA